MAAEATLGAPEATPATRRRRPRGVGAARRGSVVELFVLPTLGPARESSAFESYAAAAASTAATWRLQCDLRCRRDSRLRRRLAASATSSRPVGATAVVVAASVRAAGAAAANYATAAATGAAARAASTRRSSGRCSRLATVRCSAAGAGSGKTSVMVRRVCHGAGGRRRAADPLRHVHRARRRSRCRRGW